jgi:hypothetical protein
VKDHIGRRGSIFTGPYLRSSRLTLSSPISTRMAKQMEQCLEQLGLKPRPSIPTSSVVKHFDELRNDIVLMLQLKKQIDALDYEIRVDQERKALIENELSSHHIPITLDPEEVKVSTKGIQINDDHHSLEYYRFFFRKLWILWKYQL